MCSGIIKYMHYQHLTYGDAQSAGIYALRNQQNDRDYIGLSSTAVCKRWKTHLTLLYKGKHHCDALQTNWEAIASQFVFILLEPMRDHGVDLAAREIYWINTRNMISPVYNSMIPHQWAEYHSMPPLEYEKAAAQKVKEREQWMNRPIRR